MMTCPLVRPHAPYATSRVDTLFPGRRAGRPRCAVAVRRHGRRFSGCRAMTKILLVEDQPTAAAYLAQGLQEAGMVVDVAHTGPDGLHQLLTVTYDLAILDVMLPGLDGWSI